MISWENYEEYMMMHADGELQPAEVQELMAFIDANPSLKSELAMYELARLSPDESLIYNDKKSLLKPEPAKRTIAFPQWRKYSIAAGIALLVCVSLFKYKEANKNSGEIVTVDTIKPILPAPEDNAPAQREPKAPQAQDKIAGVSVQVHTTRAAIPDEEDKAITRHQHITSEKQRKDALASTPTPPANTATEISPLSIINTKPLPSQIAAVSPPMATIPAYDLSAPAKPAKRSLIDRLPIDDANKRQLKTITHITSEVSHSVSKVKDELSQNAITLNINNNTVHISF